MSFTEFKRIASNNKPFLEYVFFTYLDKGLYFILPILILRVAGSRETYNLVEYVLSVTNILAAFLIFISSYAFYGYTKADDKDKFASLYRDYTSISTVLVGIGVLVIAKLCSYIGIKGADSVELYISVRMMFSVFVQCINNYYRLIDRPIKGLSYSIIINFISVIMVLLFRNGPPEKMLDAFFATNIISGAVAVYFWAKSKNEIKISEYINYIKTTIVFAWPIVINCTVVAFLENYGKVYAYNFLSTGEMYAFSFVLRLSVIMQLAHGAVVSFFSKDLYLKGYTVKFIKNYVLSVAMSLAGLMALIVVYNHIYSSMAIMIDVSFCLILTYTLLHMVGGVLEVNFNRQNKNKYILMVSLVSCAIYLGLIFIAGVSSTLELALYMAVCMLSYVLMLGFTWRKVLVR